MTPEAIAEIVHQLLDEQPCDEGEVAAADPEQLSQWLREYAPDLGLPEPAALLQYVKDWQREVIAGQDAAP